MVRKLIAYGTALASTLKQRTANTDLRLIMHSFATDDIAEIFARIARALHIAAALEAKLLTYAGPPERPMPAVREPWFCRMPAGAPGEQPVEPGPSVRSLAEGVLPEDGSAGSVAPGEDRMETGLARIPSAEELAKMLRTRSIGAIIADICLGLWIRTGDTEWRDLFMVLLDNGGNPHRMFVETCDQERAYLEKCLAKCGMTMQTPWWPPMPEGWSPGAPAAVGTGPP
jgi:hypothetical protein